MSLIIENGTGLDNADSYIDLTYLTDYATKRNINITGITESNIIKAMDYFESAYSFKGTKLKETQSLAFPRLIDNEVTYPIRIKNAVCELTIKTKTAELLKDTKQKTIRKKIGDMEIEYDPNSRDETNYNMVYNLIMPYLNNNGFSHSIVRTY